MYKLYNSCCKRAKRKLFKEKDRYSPVSYLTSKILISYLLAKSILLAFDRVKGTFDWHNTVFSDLKLDNNLRIKANFSLK